MARFSFPLAIDHAAISLSVRQQPSHQPVTRLIRHMLLQGLAGSFICRLQAATAALRNRSFHASRLRA
jgi:hypothetical protein